MKKIKIALFVLVALIGLNSCREDYLNEPAPTDQVSSAVVYGSKEGAQAYLAGILRDTRTQFDKTDSGNLTSMYFARTVKGNDITYGLSHFQSDYAHENREPSYRRVNFSWEFPYKTINRLNAFIKGVTASETIGQGDKDVLLAQALTMRAFFYFEMSLEFQHTYTYNPDLPGLPIYTESDANGTEGKSISTMREVYSFIISDIEKAIQIGSFDRINKSYYNKNVTYALGARVFQVMGDWGRAADYAQKAYNSVDDANVASVLNANAYGLGFDDMDETNEWILALPQTNDQSSYYWFAPYAFSDHGTVSYRSMYINKSFVALFSNTDVRRRFTESKNTDYRQFTTNKFKFTFESDAPVIRTAEMILIRAEALYHTNPAAAADLLYQLQVNRDPNAVKSGKTGAALLEEILLERRKELYAEIGVEWFDAKRLRRGITRDSWHRIVVNLTPDDKRFFLKIPQKEIDANPNIDDSVNNER